MKRIKTLRPDAIADSWPTTTAPTARVCGTKQNVIILTSGLSGSSVLTGLIARGGYWAGDETFKKEYDTYENVDLVKLNVNLLRESAYTGRYEMEFREDLLERIGALKSSLSDTPYRDFLTECGRHEPWIWKDPRLWLTIRYWSPMLDWARCKVIVLTRSLVHCWVSTTLRRQIRSYSSLKRYEKSIEGSILKFLRENRVGYLQTTYEALITSPEETIDKLNAYLGSSLAIDDLRSIYLGRLYERPRSSPVDFLKALLIYAKNRSERWDLNERNA
jgi:hypothetical protein